MVRQSNLPPRPKHHYVYTLAYPDGTVFYVGKGQGRRALTHIDEAEQWTCQCRKCRAIQSIIFRGQQVKVSYVFENDEPGPALQREAELIRQLALDGRLVNRVHNPIGPTVPPAPLNASADVYAAWVRRNLRSVKAQRKEIHDHIKKRIRALSDSLNSQRGMRKAEKEKLRQEISELKQSIGDGWQRSFDLIEIPIDFEWTDLK